MTKRLAIVLAVSGWITWLGFLVTPVIVLEKGRFSIPIAGWAVIREAVSDIGTMWRDPGDILQVVLGLANAVILVSPVALFTRCGVWLHICAVVAVCQTLALVAVYVITEGWSWSGLGYWLWLISFVLVSGSLIIMTRATRQYRGGMAG